VFRPAGDESPVGSRFRQRIREGGRSVEYDGEVIAYEKPRHLAVRIGGKHFSVEVDYRLSESGGGTQLDYTADVTNTSLIAKIMGIVAGGMTRRIAERQLTRLKAVAEGAID
jgi:carbon monoxide dehydrogenase subunit G